MITAIYGGSFNPPHLGHASVAETVMRELAPHRLLIMPDYKAPHKEMVSCTPEPEHRLELCRLAFGHISGAEISELEIRRGGKSYTIDTLEELHSLYPGDSLVLTVGTDMLMGFDREWHRPGDILAMCTLAVCAREENELPMLKARARQLMEQLGGSIKILLNHDPHPASSTQVRAAIASGTKPEQLTDSVWEYIQKNNLYK